MRRGGGEWAQAARARVASISRARVRALMTDRARRRSTCHNSGVRMLRAVTMLCLGLTSVGGWQMTALPVPSGHAQCVSSQASARQAVAPQMCSFDHLSSEFQARRRHPAPCRSIQSCRHLSLPSRRRRGWRTSARARSLASLARCCGSTRQRARGCCSSTLASGTRACTLCRAVRRPGRPTAHTCSRSRSRRRRLASRCCCRCAVLLSRPFYLGAWIPPAPNPRVTPGARVRPGDGDEVDVGAAGRLLRRGRLRPRFRAGCFALDAARAELFRR